MEAASFNGTLAFARIAIWMLFIGNLVYQDKAGALCAILCAAFSYLAQMCYTQEWLKGGLYMHAGALIAGLVSGLCLVV